MDRYIAYLGEFPLEEQGEFDVVIKILFILTSACRKPAPHMMFVWSDQVCYCKQNFDSN